MISAIVTTSAAGSDAESFGPLQPFDAATVIEELMRNLLQSPIDELIVVTGYQRRVVERLLERRPCRLVHDWSWYQGDALTSIQVGLRSISAGVQAVLVCSGDDLALQPQRVTSLVGRLRAGDEARIVRSAGDGVTPLLLIPSSYLPQLQTAQPSQGLDHFLHEHSAGLEELA